MHLFNSKKPNIDAVFLQYGDTIYRVALARLANDADAQDVMQDVFVKYISKNPSFNDSDHQKAWFIKTAINCCNDVVRRQRHANHLPLDTAYNVAAKDDNVSDLLSLLAQLPPIYKDVVILHSLEGFTLEQTAKILKISLSAAKMRLSRAREILKILRKEEDDVQR